MKVKPLVKIDPHNSERAYRHWRYELGGPFEQLTEENAALLRQYLDDMEVGANVSPESAKGPRSYIRLRNVKTKLHSWAIILQDQLGVTYIPEMADRERDLMVLLKRMREGEIRGRSKGHIPIKAAGTYVKAFKAFWHWYERTQRKKGVAVIDVTVDLDGRDDKPKFNYFTIDDLNKLCAEANFYYRTMMLFLFDSGIRAPTEMMNIRVSDLEWNEKDGHYTLTIREEVSKTFGRRIKLLLCSGFLREFIVNRRLRPETPLFTKTPANVNKYLKNMGFKILKIGQFKGTTQMKNGKYYIIADGLTMYDFRHASACYWLPRYKSESALKYRFGWKKSDMIHYYTELLGMKDTIQEDDLYVDVTKTELERQLQEKTNDIVLLQEQVKNQDEALKEVQAILQTLRVERELKRHTSSEAVTIINEAP